MIFQDNYNHFEKRKQIHFKGGGSEDSYDKEYNARMATISEAQQGMAEEYFNFWKDSYKPMEQAQIDANMEMVPGETATWKAKNHVAYQDALNAAELQPGQLTTALSQNHLANQTAISQAELLPGATALQKANNTLDMHKINAQYETFPGEVELSKEQTADARQAIREKAPVRNAFFKESQEGVDVGGRANKAGADAAHAFAGSQAVMGRNAARMGVNPNSGRFASMTNTNALNRAKTISSARTTARTDAEKENYGRLTNAMGY